MNEELVGEEVTLTGTASEMLHIVVSTTQTFMAAVGASECDGAELETGVQQALADIGDVADGTVRVRLVVVADGIDVIVGDETEGAEPRTVPCRV